MKSLAMSIFPIIPQVKNKKAHSIYPSSLLIFIKGLSYIIPYKRTKTAFSRVFATRLSLRILYKYALLVPPGRAPTTNLSVRFYYFIA